MSQWDKEDQNRNNSEPDSVENTSAEQQGENNGLGQGTDQVKEQETDQVTNQATRQESRLQQDEPLHAAERDEPSDVGAAAPVALAGALAAHSETPKRRSGAALPWTVAVVAAAALAFVLVRGTGDAKGMNEVIGTMDGVSFTKADFYNEMADQMGPDNLSSSLDQMMTLKMLELEAGKAVGPVTEADIDAEIAQARKSYPSEEAFRQSLMQQGITEDGMRKQVKIQLELRRVFDKQINPKEEDLKKYYEDNKASFGTPEQVRASHILVEKKEDAEAILKQLKDGADFAKLAAEKSIDTASKVKGGDLNWFGRGMMNQQFEEAAFKLSKDELSGVVQSPEGYHIIKLTDKKAAVTPTYDEVKQLVRNRYIDSKSQDLISTWIDKTKTERHYKNLLSKEPAASASSSPGSSPPASKATE